MTSEEFEEFTQRIEKMRKILSWAETHDNRGKNAVGMLNCTTCPLNHYNPEWANLPEIEDLCSYNMNDSCIRTYKGVIDIWDKENAVRALEEVLNDI